MRRSHERLRGITKDNYVGLPEELKDFNYYYNGEYRRKPEEVILINR